MSQFLYSFLRFDVFDEGCQSPDFLGFRFFLHKASAMTDFSKSFLNFGVDDIFFINIYALRGIERTV